MQTAEISLDCGNFQLAAVNGLFKVETMGKFESYSSKRIPDKIIAERQIILEESYCKIFKFQNSMSAKCSPATEK